ncbi:hypothetical protein B0T21DRAFT_454861 [Apiosordaria backusii]|uniref:Uncharacterized protein n=1 Tax=Apiosordaria backusii TaxID=314023 RepID=A0AA40DH35_9PEZI|nr:hypothetical protein B0T21DRAFT_455987 [Apiosordaria backusii]KAK0710360.1 hypothetical protein B0T21DRAFT_454861 [Apiosordaria backusii]
MCSKFIGIFQCPDRDPANEDFTCAIDKWQTRAGQKLIDGGANGWWKTVTIADDKINTEFVNDHGHPRSGVYDGCGFLDSPLDAAVDMEFTPSEIDKLETIELLKSE